MPTCELTTYPLQHLNGVRVILLLLSIGPGTIPVPRLLSPLLPAQQQPLSTASTAQPALNHRIATNTIIIITVEEAKAALTTSLIECSLNHQLLTADKIRCGENCFADEHMIDPFAFKCRHTKSQLLRQHAYTCIIMQERAAFFVCVQSWDTGK